MQPTAAAHRRSFGFKVCGFYIVILYYFILFYFIFDLFILFFKYRLLPSAAARHVLFGG
jgi:hypothetical protein